MIPARAEWLPGPAADQTRRHDPSTLFPVTSKFRLVAYAEAATYLVLLAGVIVLHGFGGPDFVKIMGPIHGMVFLVYFVLVLLIREGQGWGFWKTIFVLVLSALPLGGFFVGRDLVDEPAPAAH